VSELCRTSDLRRRKKKQKLDDIEDLKYKKTKVEKREGRVATARSSLETSKIRNIEQRDNKTLPRIAIRIPIGGLQSAPWELEQTTH